jgi:hypothetical protein
MGIFNPGGGGGGAGQVQSVNGETGAVVLDAAKVNAAPFPLRVTSITPTSVSFADVVVNRTFSESANTFLVVNCGVSSQSSNFLIISLTNEIGDGNFTQAFVGFRRGAFPTKARVRVISSSGGANPTTTTLYESTNAFDVSVRFVHDGVLGWRLSNFEVYDESIENKNQANGYAGLDSNSLLTATQLPLATTSVRGALSNSDKTKLDGLEKPASGNASSTQVVLGNDTRLTDSRVPTSHSHGNITNGGLIGVTEGLPVVTGAGGIAQAGSFGGSGQSTSPARADHNHLTTAFVTISTWSRTNASALIACNGDHGCSAGNWVEIGNSGGVDGTFQVTSVPSSTSINIAVPNIASSNGSGGNLVRSGFLSLDDKITLNGLRRGAYQTIVLRFANWARGQTNYAPGNPPTGMFTLSPTTGNVVENFNTDIYHPRLFNAGQFFGIGATYRIICAVRCTGIQFDGVHCQLRWQNATTSQIIPGLADFGGGNDGVASKSYWATSDVLTAVDDWWIFVPYFGAYNGSNFANIQDCIVLAYRT